MGHSLKSFEAAPPFCVAKPSESVTTGGFGAPCAVRVPPACLALPRVPGERDGYESSACWKKQTRQHLLPWLAALTSALQSCASIWVLVPLHDWESYYYCNSSNNNNNNPSGNSETYIWKVKTWRLFCFTWIFRCLFLWQICISTNVISLPVISEKSKQKLLIMISHTLLSGYVR